jgi:membrane protease YdiL (CAAX protease family)
MTFLGLDALTWTLLAFLAGAVPFIGRADLRALRRALDRGEPDARLQTYERTIMFEWGFALLLGVVWFASGRGMESVGLVPRTGFWSIFFGVLAVGAVAWFVSVVLRTTNDPKQLGEVRAQLGPLEVAAPHTDRELSRFNWLSITAGVCEEFVYRGILMGLLMASLGAWPAILISSVVFGLAHAYQGPAGMLKTGLVGLVLAVLVVLTGSLFASMIAHAAIDLAQGRMLRAAVDPELELPADVLDAA